MVWVDSFSDCFTGDAVAATVSVLAAAGYAPRLVERPACCGLTWISTGQLDGARRQLRTALDILHPYVAAGTPVVGLEPSCLAVWRSDAAELVPDDPRVAEVAAGVLTMAELLGRTPDWTPPDLSGVELVVQPHCHHASVLGWQADATLLAATGATVTTLGGCCGLAGNFGVEKGHYEVSVKVAEHDLLPAVAAHPDALVLADGFSCRTQLAQLADRTAITLAGSSPTTDLSAPMVVMTTTTLTSRRSAGEAAMDARCGRAASAPSRRSCCPRSRRSCPRTRTIWPRPRRPPRRGCGSRSDRGTNGRVRSPRHIREVEQRIFQRLERLDVKIIGRFVEQQQVAAHFRVSARLRRLRSPPDSTAGFCWSGPLKPNEAT